VDHAAARARAGGSPAWRSRAVGNHASALLPSVAPRKRQYCCTVTAHLAAGRLPRHA
jgi:hypothetical protein